MAVVNIKWPVAFRVRLPKAPVRQRRLMSEGWVPAEDVIAAKAPR
jgi:hypothetical protein